MLSLQGCSYFFTIKSRVLFNRRQSKFIHNAIGKVNLIPFSLPPPIAYWTNEAFLPSILINLYVCCVIFSVSFAFLSIYSRELYRSLSSMIKSHYLCIHAESVREEMEKVEWVTFLFVLLENEYYAVLWCEKLKNSQEKRKKETLKKQKNKRKMWKRSRNWDSEAYKISIAHTMNRTALHVMMMGWQQRWGVEM